MCECVCVHTTIYDCTGSDYSYITATLLAVKQSAISIVTLYNIHCVFSVYSCVLCVVACVCVCVRACVCMSVVQ